MPPTPPRFPPPEAYPIPKLKLRIDDLKHDGVKEFFNAVDTKTALFDAVLASFHTLYTPETVPRSVKEITLVLSDMDGVAHTTGSATHKEIYFSLNYIHDVCKGDRGEHEINGVLVHEVVHCYQHNGRGACPGGLIEGVADYVRLKAGFAPPHWQRTGECDWDAGYERTGYFLAWMEARFGEGIVKRLNMLMKDRKYTAYMFKEVSGHTVNELWTMYCEALQNDDDTVADVEDEGESPSDSQVAGDQTEWPIPKFNIRVEDVAHPGVEVFYTAIKPIEVLTRAVMASFKTLYTLETVPRRVQEITLVLRSMNGVAHTFGSPTHKEIHYNLNYIKGFEHRAVEEITGVLVHEVVHCYQYNAKGSCPGGIIEGIADYVRLTENLGPPHWRKWPLPERWDAGYDSTAFFLEWVEFIVGPGTVALLNERMKKSSYKSSLLAEVTGWEESDLWDAYRDFREDEHQQSNVPEPPVLSVQKDS